MRKHRKAKRAARAPALDKHTAGIMRALERAAQRAREIAIQTGTPYVIYRNGRIEKIMLTEDKRTVLD
jgi:hypothetical protein